MNRLQHFAQLVAATKESLHWMSECGEESLLLPDNFVMPDFEHVSALWETGDGEPKVVSSSRNSDEGESAKPPVEQDMIQRLAAAAGQPRAKTKVVAPAPAPRPSTNLSTPVHVNDGPVKGGEMAQRAADLFTLNERIRAAMSLPETASGPKTEWIFGHGHPGARLMFVADGPRAVDNELGLPFVGDDGRLLSRMVHAMGLSRSDVYLSYIVPFYDPRTEPEAHFDACESFFAQRVDIVKPDVIVVFGESAARRLSGRKDAFPHLRGQWFEYRERPLLPTFHPEVLLQMPKGKAHVWQDLKAVMRFMGLTRTGTKS